MTIVNIISLLILPVVLAYPYYVLSKKGSVEFSYHYGILFGFNFSTAYFQAKVKYIGADDSTAVDKTYKMKSFEYHLLFITIVLCFSREHKII